MKIIFSAILILLNICFNQLCFSQSKISKFRGHIIHNSGAAKIERAIVTYTEKDEFRGLNTETSSPNKPIDSSGNFSFDLPSLNRPYKFTLAIRGEASFAYYLYTEPGDDIEINTFLSDINIDSVVFSGLGSEKYNLRLWLYREYNQGYLKALGKLNLKRVDNIIDLEEKLKALTILCKNYNTKADSMISHSLLSKEMKDIMTFEFVEYYKDWAFRLELLYKQNLEYRDIIRKYYFENSASIFNEPNASSIHAPIYIRDLTSKIALELLMNDKADKVNMVKLYATIKNKYSEALLDRLIGNMFLLEFQSRDLSFTEDQRDSVMNDAINVVKTPHIKQALEEKKLVFKNLKRKLYLSSFTKVDGSKLDLASLKGKVIMIDVWFLGCKGCAQFHRIYEENVHDQFKNNKEFVFLSINIDAKKENWFAGLKSKKYASDDYINVTTDGLGTKHPFTLHYGIAGGPWLMLVDKNMNIYAQPSHTIMDKPGDLTALINGALDIKDNNK